MEEGKEYGGRDIYLNRLHPPADRQPGALTDREIMDLTKKGIVRSSHYLWLSEQYMMDMAKLRQGEEFDAKLAQLGEVCGYMEYLLSKILKP